MGFLRGLLNELAKRQGFEAGIRGEPPRIFFGEGGDHKKSYNEGYEMGKKTTSVRALHRVSEKFLK